MTRERFWLASGRTQDSRRSTTIRESWSSAGGWRESRSKFTTSWTRQSNYSKRFITILHFFRKMKSLWDRSLSARTKPMRTQSDTLRLPSSSGTGHWPTWSLAKLDQQVFSDGPFSITSVSTVQVLWATSTEVYKAASINQLNRLQRNTVSAKATSMHSESHFFLYYSQGWIDEWMSFITI